MEKIAILLIPLAAAVLTTGRADGAFKLAPWTVKYARTFARLCASCHGGKTMKRFELVEEGV
jgi:hypothetical protein